MLDLLIRGGLIINGARRRAPIVPEVAGGTALEV